MFKGLAMKFSSSYEVTALFQLETFKADGSVTHKGPEFFNEVLNCGLLQLATTALNSATGVINLGSSDIPVDINQTGLQARTYSTSKLFETSPGYYYVTSYSRFPVYCEQLKIFQFNIGTCTGTHREIGLSAGTNVNYFNRQLIKDVNGDPTTLVVAADEGLRINVKLRVYCKEAVYGEIWKLKLFNPSSGSITLSNGVTTTIISSTQWGAVGKFKSALQTLCGAANVYNVEGTKATEFFIYSSTLLQQSLNLSIQSTTLVDNTQAPSLEIVQNLVVRTTKFVELKDTRTGDTVDTIGCIEVPWFWKGINSYEPLSGPLFTQASEDQVVPWGYYGGSTLNVIQTWAFGGNILRAKTNTETGSSKTPSSEVVLTNATIDNLKITKKCYYAPAALGAGTVQVLGLEGYLFRVFFDKPISISDTEEFFFEYEISWGRFTPP